MSVYLGTNKVGSGKYEPKVEPKTLSIILSASSWNSSTNTLTVTATGVTSNNIVFVAPFNTGSLPDSITNYTDSSIWCSGQGTDSLTFTCSTIPSSNINVNVTFWG